MHGNHQRNCSIKPSSLKVWRKGKNGTLRRKQAPNPLKPSENHPGCRRIIKPKPPRTPNLSERYGTADRPEQSHHRPSEGNNLSHLSDTFSERSLSLLRRDRSRRHPAFTSPRLLKTNSKQPPPQEKHPNLCHSLFEADSDSNNPTCGSHGYPASCSLSISLARDAEDSRNHQKSDKEQDSTCQKQADKNGESRQDIHFLITGEESV